jgi:hypothetical protein
MGTGGYYFHPKIPNTLNRYSRDLAHRHAGHAVRQPHERVSASVRPQNKGGLGMHIDVKSALLGAGLVTLSDQRGHV